MIASMEAPPHTSLGGGFCYGCVSESELQAAVVDGKDVLLCQRCDPERTNPSDTETAQDGDSS